MQKWLKSKLTISDGLRHLIIPWQFDTGEDERQLSIARSYNYCLDSINHTYLISDDENISSKKGEVLKPDFILYSAESQAVIVIELKNISGPSRQAGTELSAYAAEVRSYIPLLANSDVISIIISTAWPPLLRRYVLNEILWANKPVLCLEPIEAESEIKLRPIDPKSIIDDSEAKVFGKHHLAGFHICLYDNELYSGGSRERLDQYTQLMKTALGYIASTGAEQYNNGFAFLWKNKRSDTIAPYFITLVNVAPFKLLDTFASQLGGTSFLDNMARISAENGANGQGASLGVQTTRAIEFLKSFCSPLPEGFLNWGQLEELVFEDSELIAFEGWGVFRVALFEALKRRYTKGDFKVSATDPELGREVIQELIDSKIEETNIFSIYNKEDEYPDLDQQFHFLLAEKLNASTDELSQWIDFSLPYFDEKGEIIGCCFEFSEAAPASLLTEYSVAPGEIVEIYLT